MRIPFRKRYGLTIAHRAGAFRPWHPWPLPWPLPWSAIARRPGPRHPHRHRAQWGWLIDALAFSARRYLARRQWQPAAACPGRPPL